MSIPVIGFFNPSDGIGKTSLVYHLSWMYSDLRVRVIAADLDPQAKLTATFLDEQRIEELWHTEKHQQTIYGCIQPLLEGGNSIAPPHIEIVSDIPGQKPLFPEYAIGLLVGDLQLAQTEDRLSNAWSECLNGSPQAFHITSAFWHAIQQAAIEHDAQLVLLDVGSNLGAINRAALLAADFAVIPLSPDLFSVQGLHILGPTRYNWYQEWQIRLQKKPDEMLAATPAGEMQPEGYIVLQHQIRLDLPFQTQGRWLARIPDAYRKEVLDEQNTKTISIANDPNCLALLKNYRSLMPLAEEARKPIFQLKPADGAMGAYMSAVLDARQEFQILARTIAQHVGVKLPE